MKKLISFIFTLFLIFAISTCAFAFEYPERLFSVDASKVNDVDEVISYAVQKGFNGIIIDLRKSDSIEFYEKAAAICPDEIQVYVFAGEEFVKEIPNDVKIVVDANISEDLLKILSDEHGFEKTVLYLPFEDETALSAAKLFYEKGYFKTVLAENLLSCHSEYGYEEYLLDISETFSDSKIISLNRHERLFIPISKGDFYGDIFELNNQYLVNRIQNIGFCVSDFSSLKKNLGGSADFLTAYFDSDILDKYANFSISKKLEITRPVRSSISVETDSYTIFGTSDPTKPLYMNGEEIERISSSGLFAVTVKSSKSGIKYTFTQSGASDSVVIKKSSSISSGTTKKLSSLAPQNSSLVTDKNTVFKLSCVGPSGGYVTATVQGKTVVLKQVAYADKGVPAKFSGEIDLSGEYPENEVVDLGKVTYALSYGGETSTYKSGSNIYFIGNSARLAIRANAELAGVEKASVEEGNYLTTLRTGCLDYVDEITENGWYKVSCGGYMKPSHCDIVVGNSDIINSVSAYEREIGENYEKLILKCSALPAFKGEINGKVFSITLFNTKLSDFSSTDLNSDLMYRINPVDNGDGSITVYFFSRIKLWGWDVFTDPESNSFSIVLKGTPKLSDDPSKPLSGITVTVCSGHGGTDPGALSVAGENGVNEAQINLANTLAIAEAVENLGAKTIVIAADDKKLDTYARTDPARYAYTDIYVCCHANSIAENANANLWCGTYVYYHFEHSAEFSKKLCDYISASTNRDNEGAEQGYYSVTRLTMCPAVMLEVGFVSNPKELESLIDPRDIQKTAFAVTKSILEILNY